LFAIWIVSPPVAGTALDGVSAAADELQAATISEKLISRPIKAGLAGSEIKCCIRYLLSGSVGKGDGLFISLTKHTSVRKYLDVTDDNNHMIIFLSPVKFSGKSFAIAYAALSESVTIMEAGGLLWI
jgi:hypothetical protein